MNCKLINKYALVHGLTTTEAEVVITEILMSMAERVATKFTFGYHTAEDIQQQCLVFGLEVLETDKYDVQRPLANFLYTHMHNRIINYKRDNYIRSEPPCSCCDPFNPPASPCDKWKAWSKRNFSKQSLMSLKDISGVAETPSYDYDPASLREIESLIDENLPIELRSDYLKMRSGVSVPRNRKEKVRNAILIILEGYDCG